MPKIKLITFDLDNTLWAVDPVIIEAERKMRHELQQLVPDFNQRFDAPAMQQLRLRAIEEQPEIRHDLSLTRQYVLGLALREAGLDREQAEREAARTFDIFLDARHDVTLFEAAEATLKTLDQHYQLAALTNGNADVFRLNIGRHFDFQHSSASVAASKPSPEMFHQALADSGVAAHEAVHVGDNPIDDIHGAQAVGMHTVWVNLLPTTQAPESYSATVTHLAQLPQVIHELG